MGVVVAVYVVVSSGSTRSKWCLVVSRHGRGNFQERFVFSIEKFPELDDSCILALWPDGGECCAPCANSSMSSHAQ